MGYFVFVDNSNVWIEGKYVSAVKRGFAKNVFEAHSNNCQDYGWAIDFGRLLYTVTETNIADVKKAVLFGSKPTDKDSLWNAMEKSGFEVRNHPRNVSNKEKKIDTGIVASLMETLYTEAQEGDEFVLVMGDADFVPVMEKIHKRGMKATVAFWSHASGELKMASDKFIDLNTVIDSITYS